MTTRTQSLAEFLLARIAEDEEAARMCAEMFPSPWDVADRGWRVRIYASEVPEENFFSDDPDAMTERNPVVMEVEPDRNIQDPRWLSERVEHVRRHDPARVLAECEAKRRIVDLHPIYRGPRILAVDSSGIDYGCELCHATSNIDDESVIEAVGACDTLRALALPYADHPEFRPEWRP